MKSITIHGIDTALDELIKSKARSQGLSVNQIIKEILEEALGVKPQTIAKRRRDFEEFSGVWSDLELAEFQEKKQKIYNAWIAAHAIETGSTVITYDNHFKNVAGLRLWGGT